MTPVAEVYLRRGPHPFVAEAVEREPGLLTATGRFRYRRHPATEWGPRVSRSWPVRELREVRWFGERVA